MKHTTKLLVLIATVVSTVAVAGVGWAFWSSSGSGSASASVGALAPPTGVTVPANSSGSVAVSWTASSTASPNATPQGYYVQRTQQPSGPTTAACGTSPTTLTTSPCSDLSVPGGFSYKYTVTAVYHSWTAASTLSNAVTVSNVGPLDHFLVAAPSAGTAGTPFDVTVTAKDVSSNTVTTFVGLVHFTSTDVQATSGSGLPADYNFTSGAGFDNGAHVFTNGVTLRTAGNKTVSVSSGGKSGTSATITVSPATASSLVLAAASTTPTAGVADNLTITAKDTYGNTATGYTGDKNLTFGGANAIGGNNPTVSNKTGSPTTFGTATVITFTNGAATVSGVNNGVMRLYKAETANITVTDSTITNGTGLSVTVSPIVTATASSLVLTAASTTPTAGVADNLAVKALDSFGNIDTGYTGSKSLIFTGASAIGTNNPTVTNTSGTPISFGSTTAITFTNGVSTTGGVMTLYKAETAGVIVTQGTISNGAGLSVTVPAAGPVALSFTDCSKNGGAVTAGSCPSSLAVGNNGSMDANVSVLDSYGNLATVGASSVWSITVGSNNSNFVVTNSPVTITGTSNKSSTTFHVKYNGSGTDSATLTASASSGPSVTNTTMTVSK
jgi:hypothetical protein